MSAAHYHSGRIAGQVVQQQLLRAGPRCPRGRGAQVQVDQLRGLRKAAAGGQQARRQKLGCGSEEKRCGSVHGPRSGRLTVIIPVYLEVSHSSHVQVRPVASILDHLTAQGSLDRYAGGQLLATTIT